MEVIFLGTGSSAGTPVIGCGCDTCLSTDPRNQRTRCSIALRMEDGAVLLVDTGPDLRLQALRENLTRVDAVLYTHYHADHLNGLDDLRSFCHLQRQPIPVYGNEATMQGIVQRFGYAFPRHEQHHWDKPVLKAHAIDASFVAGGVNVVPVPVMHGKHYEILAYRIGNMAYLTDVSDISPASLEKLRGLDYLLLDCLRYRPHPTHFSMEEAVAWAEKIGARETYLIHMTHELEFSELSALLPANVRPAYDGLRLQC
ncbi:MAG: MBL fold metallo-hydrolase [Sulfurimicrobium sp.]|jgi:phosphoribosyl 1,2-cyclic phosphate phosphodiesterase|nr:MBL fold metallo-hydrolase [Sulfurimicrobium sp.]MDZ7654651.1 MBL fold metallo-hydrolase [Sulfurimicrobium sp.]